MRKGTVAFDKLPPIDEKEALRYAGVRGTPDEGTAALWQTCVQELESFLSPKGCFLLLEKEELFSSISGARESVGLNEALLGAERVLLFGTTLGLAPDRLLARYSLLAPSKALLLQGIGAERIERVCDELCRQVAEDFAREGLALGRRFSPGFGDFPLSAQRDIFALLDCAKRIGLTLTDGLMMSPSKSVTAIVGLKKTVQKQEDCATCEKTDCEYRV